MHGKGGGFEWHELWRDGPAQSLRTRTAFHAHAGLLFYLSMPDATVATARRCVSPGVAASLDAQIPAVFVTAAAGWS